MAADCAPQQACMAERIQAAVFSVALTGGKEKRQVSRFISLKKTPLQRDQKGIRDTDAHKSGCTEGIAGLNYRDSSAAEVILFRISCTRCAAAN
jgi:hypothetical protein